MLGTSSQGAMKDLNLYLEQVGKVEQSELVRDHLEWVYVSIGSVLCCVLGTILLVCCRSVGYCHTARGLEVTMISTQQGILCTQSRHSAGVGFLHFFSRFVVFEKLLCISNPRGLRVYSR